MDYIKAIIDLRDHPKMEHIYDIPSEMVIRLEEPINKEQIKKIADKYNLKISDSFIDFYTFSNGISVHKVYDYRLFPINDIENLLKLEIEQEEKEPTIIDIGNIFEYVIRMDCSTENNYISASLEGIDDPIHTGLTFKDFMIMSVKHDFNVFWE